MNICSDIEKEVSMNNDQCGTRIVHAEKVVAAKEYDLPPPKIEGLTILFKALADTGRLRILHALAKQEMCVCDLAAFLDVSESAVSHQLRLLRNCGLVINRRDGTVLYYRLKNDEYYKLLRQGLALL